MTMTQHLDWKLGKFVEWCTHLPYQNRPQISPVLVIENINCFFELRRCSDKCYYLYLKPESEGIKLEPFSLTIYIICNKTTDANRYEAKFSDSNTCFFYFSESFFTYQDMNHGLRVRFLFALEENVGLRLLSENKIDDKSVQTTSYIDARFSLEESSKDYAKLLDNGPNHDVEFAIGDQIIKAHKSILCCRSDVFISMFQSDMVEGKTGRVNIRDIDAAIFRHFLEYLYTGMLPELTVDIAMQLYVASNKYAVNVLKLQCADFLIHNLSLENACEILVLADLHNDLQLKKSVIKYIYKEKIPVKLEKEKWSNFCNENKDLAIEVYDSFCGHFWQQ